MLDGRAYAVAAPVAWNEVLDEQIEELLTAAIRSTSA